PTFDPPRISPPPASARSCCAAASPFPRSRSVKHFDSLTYTLMRASGDSRLYWTHQRFSGSWTASVPIFLSHFGISGGGASLAKAAAADRNPSVSADAPSARYDLELSMTLTLRILCAVTPTPTSKA